MNSGLSLVPRLSYLRAGLVGPGYEATLDLGSAIMHDTVFQRAEGSDGRG